MTVTAEIFKAPDIDGTADEFAAALPRGRVWAGKLVDGTNIRALIAGSSMPFNMFEQKVEELATEFDINQTTLLIDEWEESVGLPDDCFTFVGNIQDRRDAVIRRLNKSPLVTLAELQAYINSFLDGVGVTLYTAKQFYSLPFHLPQPLIGDVERRFIIVAEIERGGSRLPFSLPQHLVRGVDTTNIRCLLERVLPANVYLLIRESL